MNKEEYRSKIKEIRKAMVDAEEELARQYAYENNPYAIGSIAKDENGVIRVDEIHVMYDGYTLPYCHYYGTILTDKLAPAKGNKKRSIFQNKKIP